MIKSLRIVLCIVLCGNVFTSAASNARKEVHAVRYNLVQGMPDVYVSYNTERIGHTWSNGVVWDKPLIERFCSLLQGDCGRSSIYAPKEFSIEHIIDVPIFSLSDFFDLFPFDTHPVIDYIKIDAQGADLDIVKSAGHYLQERVVYITLEAEDYHYENTNNSGDAIDSYMKNLGFVRHFSHQTADPTYFNPRYTEYVENNHVQIYQKG